MTITVRLEPVAEIDALRVDNDRLLSELQQARRDLHMLELRLGAEVDISCELRDQIREIGFRPRR